MITHSRMTAIITKYHGPGNVRGSRITADAGMKRRISVSYNHEIDADGNHAAAAQALCDKFAWKGDLRSGGREDGMCFVFSDI